jgi:hypothetical protein
LEKFAAVGGKALKDLQQFLPWSLSSERRVVLVERGISPSTTECCLTSAIGQIARHHHFRLMQTTFKGYTHQTELGFVAAPPTVRVNLRRNPNPNGWGTVTMKILRKV